MNEQVFPICLIIFALLFTETSTAQIVKDTDEFTGITTYQVNEPIKLKIEEGSAFQAYYAPKFVGYKWVVQYVLVGDKSSSDDLQTPFIYMLLDGERESKLVEFSDVDLVDNSIVYSLKIIVETEDFHKIAFANKMRVKIGDTVLNIPFEKRLQMRNLFETIKNLR